MSIASQHTNIEDGSFGQPGVCVECGEECFDVDEATELCEMCFGYVFGVSQ